jgi:hypothetical protein
VSLVKTGPHIILDTTPALQWAQQANVVKVLDRPWLLRGLDPSVLTIYRKYFADQSLERNGADVAREIVADCQQAGVVPTYCELYNETAQYPWEGLERHIELVREAVPVIHAYGSRVAGFSFSTGNPNEAEWRLLRERNYGDCDAIAIRQYWSVKGFTEGNALRHRLVHQWTEGQHPPLIVGECGRDGIDGCDLLGWRAQGIDADTFAWELHNYDHELQKDDYVLAATPFTNGPTAGWPKWEAFDVDPVVPRLLEIGTERRQLWPT